MAKKKKHKKHNFNGAKSKAAPAAVSTAPVAEASADVSEVVTSAKPVAAPKPQLTTAEEQHLLQIKSDVRRVIILAISFVAIQVVLWFLFEHTGVGPAVYGLIHH